MMKSSTETKKVYLGFDVSQKSVEVMPSAGKLHQKAPFQSKMTVMRYGIFFRRTAKVCVVMETGTHALWMNRAASLLRENELSIKTIAFQSRYEHTRYFSLEFRKYYNCSPQEYRNSHQF